MAKIGLYLVFLLIGFIHMSSVSADIPTDVDVFNFDQIANEEQLLPTKVEDYPNDETNGEMEEGSGHNLDETPLEEDTPVAEDTDKMTPEETDAQTSKEKDITNEEIDADEVGTAKKSDEAVEVIPEAEPVEEATSTSSEKDNTVPQVEPVEDGTSKATEDENTAPQVEPVEEATSKGAEDEEPADEEEEIPLYEIVEDTETKPDDSQQQTVDESTNKSVDESTNKSIVNGVSQENGTDENIDQEANVSVPENSYKDDSVETIPIEIQSKPIDNTKLFGELEQVEPQTDNKDIITDDREAKTLENPPMMFAHETDLPAERLFGKTRGVEKASLQVEEKPMDEDKTRGIEKPVSTVNDVSEDKHGEVETQDHDVHNHEDESKKAQNQEINAEDLNDNELKVGSADTPADDPGASSASSGSNTITFVVIIAIVGIVGVLGYFVHRRRKAERATPVPLEDRELKEVKTHRPNDGINGGSQQKASHIPEANPLILTNDHFKRGDPDTQKNGYLANEPKPANITSGEPKKDDDIRMMDEDAEEDIGAERTPLFMGTFKPEVQRIRLNNDEEAEDRNSAATEQN